MFNGIVVVLSIANDVIVKHFILIKITVKIVGFKWLANSRNCLQIYLGKFLLVQFLISYTGLIMFLLFGVHLLLSK